MRRRRDIKETNHRSTAFSSLADSGIKGVFLPEEKLLYHEQNRL
jgi:hypothetical protein